MKVQNKKNKKPLQIIIISSIVLVLILLGVFLLTGGGENKNMPDKNKDSTKIQEDLNTKQDLITNPDSQDAPPSQEANTDSITITSSQTTTDVIIYTKLNNISSGTCNLKITNGTKTYENTASIIYQTEFSTCAGFTVPKDSLNGHGMWNVVLTVNNETLNITKTAVIEVT